jgi:hypothetical protein
MRAHFTEEAIFTLSLRGMPAPSRLDVWLFAAAVATIVLLAFAIYLVGLRTE